MDQNTIRNYLRLAAPHGFDDTTSDGQLSGITAEVIRSVHGDEANDPELGVCVPMGHPPRIAFRLAGELTITT